MDNGRLSRVDSYNGDNSHTIPRIFLASKSPKHDITMILLENRDKPA